MRRPGRVALFATLAWALGVSDLADAYCQDNSGQPGDSEAISVSVIGGAVSCGSFSGAGPHACGPPATSERTGTTLSVTATCWSSATITIASGGLATLTGPLGGSFGVRVASYDATGSTLTTTLSLDPTGSTPTLFQVLPEETDGVTAETPADDYAGTIEVVVSGGL